MNQLFTSTYPASTLNPSEQIILNITGIDEQDAKVVRDGKTLIADASIEELIDMIVADMIALVKEDLASISFDDTSLSNSKK